MPSCGQSTPTTKNGLGKSRTGSSPLASAGAAPQRVEYDGDVATPVTGLDSVKRMPAESLGQVGTHAGRKWAEAILPQHANRAGGRAA